MNWRQDDVALGWKEFPYEKDDKCCKCDPAPSDKVIVGRDSTRFGGYDSLDQARFVVTNNEI